MEAGRSRDDARPKKRDLIAGVFGALMGAAWLTAPLWTTMSPDDQFANPYASYSFRSMWPGGILLFTGGYYLSRWLLARRGIDFW